MDFRMSPQLADLRAAGTPPLTDFAGIVGTSACVFTNPAAGLDSGVSFWDFCRVGACLL